MGHAYSLPAEALEKDVTVSQLLVQAFMVARGRLSDVQKAWGAASRRTGGLLPDSLIMMSVQRLGDLDLVLRCMEDERASARQDAASVESDPLQFMLSEQWVGAAYAVAWVLKEREPSVCSWQGFDALAHDLRLLRIPLEKYEIVADKKLPAELTSMSRRGSAMWLALDLDLKERWIERRELSDRAIEIWIGP